MWVARGVDSISDLVPALLHTVILILSCSYWDYLACHGLDFAFVRVGPIGSLVILALISCFTSLTTSQSFSADESSVYSSYGISPSMHELVLHITELLLFYSVPRMHLFFLSAALILFCINTFF